MTILTVGSPTTDAGLAVTGLQIARRTIRKFVRSPQIVAVTVAQGALFLLIFRYVFGGAISTGGVSYVDFLVPGYVVTSVLFAGMGAATGVAEDVEQGLFDRLRSLPIPRTAVMAGRALADTVLLTGTLLATIAVGFAVGFRIHTDVGSAIAAVGLCIVVGFAFDWLFIFLGLIAGNAQAAQGMSLLVFPLTFASSAYVPVHTMPGWLQAFAAHQPMTIASNAVRALSVGPRPGESTGHLVIESIIWSIGIVAVFAPMAVARYARRG